MKIRTTGNKGIQLISSDETIFSFQFGPGNYCENYHDSIMDQAINKLNTESQDCEVAVISRNENWVTRKFFGDYEHCDDMVCGHVPLKEALEIALNYEKNLNK